MPDLILASGSPRRRELLSCIGVDFGVQPVEVEEVFGNARDPQILARRLAREKAEAARLAAAMPPILAADTIVWLDGEAFGKPSDAQSARQMLRALRGRVHQVVTGIAVIPAGKRNALVRTPVTEVQMREYTDEEIEESIWRGDPFDKAGGYGIQDTVFQPVQQYLGCYCNVVGLSLWATIELMHKVGLSPAHPAQTFPQCEHCPLRPR